MQPYGEYWRLGANEATVFEINSPIYFNDKKLEAGKYALYAYPGENIWTICVNSDWDRWGAQEADKSKDLLRTEVKSINDAPVKEQFEISAVDLSASVDTSLPVYQNELGSFHPLKIVENELVDIFIIELLKE